VTPVEVRTDATIVRACLTLHVDPEDELDPLDVEVLE
jgi:hypothetical protein